MASVPEIILNNPFRVLGVYANSSYREIVAGVSKATKFMEVGRIVDYPLDLPRVKKLKVKSKLGHSLEDLDNALASISNSEERLKYAQFWFLRMTPLDDEAFNLLFSGKPNHALSVWNREDNLSSLQNKVVLYLWKCEFKYALQVADRLYNLFAGDFLKAVDSKGTLVKSTAELVQSFVDTLAAYLSPKELFDSIPSSFLRGFIVPTISEDAITKINNALQDAKDQLDLLNHEGYKINQALPNLGIGGRLLHKINDELSVLQKVSEPDNPRLQLISDRLANMLYECSIDEYNIRKYSPDYSLRLLQQALTLANNSLDKEEINNKIDLFQKKVEELQQPTQNHIDDTETGCLLTILFFLGILLLMVILTKGCVI